MCRTSGVKQGGRIVFANGTDPAPTAPHSVEAVGVAGEPGSDDFRAITKDLVWLDIPITAFRVNEAETALRDVGEHRLVGKAVIEMEGLL